MAEASDYLETSLATHTFISTWSPKATYVFALCTVQPTDGMHGGTITETDYTSYTRVAYERGATWWSETNGTANNSTAVMFPEATGGDSDVAWYAILEGGTALAASTSAAMICYGALTATLSVSSGITPQFPASTVTVNFA